MSLVDRPDVLEQGRVGLSPIARVSGSGSISTLSVDEDAAAAAEKRRAPIGFRAPMTFADVPLGGDVVMGAYPAFLESMLTASLNAAGEKIERQLRDVGECLWTARDTVVVYSGPNGDVVGYP